MALSTANDCATSGFLAATGNLERRLHSGYERALFAKMVERAEAAPEYKEQLVFWLSKGSTLLLRDLSKPFGSYWRDLAFANLVDGIDSAHCNYCAA